MLHHTWHRNLFIVSHRRGKILSCENDIYKHVTRAVLFTPGRSDEGEIRPPSPLKALTIRAPSVPRARPAVGVRRYAGLCHADRLVREVLQETGYTGH